MATTGLNLNSLGLDQSTATSGSGIDVTSVVNQILDADRAPEKLWQQQLANSQSESAAISSINSSVSALSDTVNSLKDSFGALTTKIATSSQTSILTADAQSSAANGTHVIVVKNLASTGTAYSDAVADASTTFSTGTITLSVGGSTQDIQVDSSHNTLTTLAASINSQNLGVTASVINDASGSRLAIVGNSVGAGGDLTVTSNTTGLAMNKGTPGQNASLSIDGVPYSSASNTVTGAIPGVTLHLAGSAPNAQISLVVGANSSGAAQAVTDFVSAYNNVIKAINAQFKFDPTSNQAGVLAGDGSLRSLQSSLLADATYSITGNNGLVNLASLGVNMNDDGTLTVDNAKLTSVIGNQFTDFQNFFQSASNGFALHFGSDLLSITDPSQGLLTLDLAQHSAEQKSLNDEIANFEDRLATVQQQLIAQYSRVDATLRQFPMIMAQINAQLGTLSSGK
jgi:flagellar hook-associated protein 2